MQPNTSNTVVMGSGSRSSAKTLMAQFAASGVGRGCSGAEGESPMHKLELGLALELGMDEGVGAGALFRSGQFRGCLVNQSSI